MSSQANSNGEENVASTSSASVGAKNDVGNNFGRQKSFSDMPIAQENDDRVANVSTTSAALKEVVSDWGVYLQLRIPRKTNYISVALGIEDEVFVHITSTIFE